MPKKLPPEIQKLRSLPKNLRAEAIINMHKIAEAQMRFAMSEWAALVLEDVKPPRKKR